MKITLEKEEWQLLGQLALEVGKGRFRKGLSLYAVILWEFFAENAQAFQQPQRRKRNLRTSTVIGIYQYLKAENLRDEAFWDITLQDLRNKLYKALVPTIILEHETPF